MATDTKSDPRITYTRPWLYPLQESSLFNDSRYAVVEASTKSGKTVVCILWLAEQAFSGKAGQNYWWIAPIYAQAKIAYRRMKKALPEQLYRSNEGELTITLWNGTVIWFKGSTDPDALYGEDVYAAVVDEASRVKEESWHALRSTLTYTKGPVRFIGNVKGKKNWFYRMARRAEAHERGYHYTKITWRDAVEAKVLDMEEIESARRDLPELVFRELYEAEAADDVNNPFGIEHIRNCISPLSSQRPRVFGWDLAKHVDWTVGIGLEYGGPRTAAPRWSMRPAWEIPSSRGSRRRARGSTRGTTSRRDRSSSSWRASRWRSSRVRYTFPITRSSVS